MSLILLPDFLLLLEAIVSLFVKAEFERNRENNLQHKSYLKFWYPAWHLNGLTLSLRLRFRNTERVNTENNMIMSKLSVQ